jgi:chemosensory pili system protein ChpA (sensor histidine kinase/response regulator)
MEQQLAFADELEDVALQLATLTGKITDNTEQYAAISANILAEYQRLNDAAALLNIPSAQALIAWIYQQLSNFDTNLPDANIELLQTGLLVNWLELTAVALREPEDSSHLASISTELTNPDWPEPMPMELLENFLLGLHQTNHAAFNHHTDLTEETTIDSQRLGWDADVHPELLQAYLAETPTQIAEVANLIRQLAQNNASSAQKRQAARLAHTIKGASAVVGVRPLASFTHSLEDLLELPIASYLVEGLDETLQASADCLESLFDNLQAQKDLPNEYALLHSDLSEWITHITEHVTSQEPEPLEATSAALSEMSAFIAPLDLDEESSNSEDSLVGITHTATYLNVSSKTIQDLLNLTGELITTNSQIAEYVERTFQTANQMQQHDNRVRQMLDELQEAIDQQQVGQVDGKINQAANADFDQLELDHYNSLHSGSGLLSEALADSRDFTRHVQMQLRKLSDQIYQQQRLQRQLSDLVLNTRVVPIQSIVPRLERTVRETCRQTGKQARLEIQGADLHIDTDILKALTDALLHMLRNAIDHGIETSEVRSAASKPPNGLIQLNFSQRGDRIHISLQDDGQGIDLEKVKQRALERKLISNDQTLTPEATLELILQPGFTTRDTVSEVSGRGVGMDVVKAAVDDLQGLIHLQSTLGQGTQFYIQIPPTLIATNALLIAAGEHLVAIPSNQVKQIYFAPPSEYFMQDGSWYINYHGNPLEVIVLAQLLGWPTPIPDLKQAYSFLIVETEVQTHALYINEIQNPREIVVKSLTHWFNLSQGVSGACILANGTIASVLDMPRLMRSKELGLLQVDNRQIFQAKPATEKTTLLVVDDSLSNRKALSLMIEQMGYQAITAIDGMDALKQLHEHNISLILTDLEMPRMNGLELTQAVRIWPEMRHIPIIMITSRSTQKHKNMADTAGIDEYLTKPVDRLTLENHVEKWLSAELAA